MGCNRRIFSLGVQGMKKKLLIIAGVFAALALLLCLNVAVRQKFIHTYTCTEIEYRGYTAKDIKEIKIDHSYFRRLIGYNEWRISVEFTEVPDVFFWFSYRGGKIIFEGVSSAPLMDKDSVIAYSEKFKNGTLLR